MIEKLDIRRATKTPIPDPPAVYGWKEVKIQESGEPLVPLGPFSDDYREVFTSSIYFGEADFSPYHPKGILGSNITVFVRKSVAESLLTAERMLSGGYHLVVFDGHRTVEVQASLFDEYFTELKTKHPDWSEARLLSQAQEFVSLPSRDPMKPSPHNTGGSVDVVLVKLPSDLESQLQRDTETAIKYDELDWRKSYLAETNRSRILRSLSTQLDFGTPFDHGSDLAYLTLYEALTEMRDRLTAHELTARANRRLLYHLMTHPKVGFQPYEHEWWHYNLGNQMAAKTAGAEFAKYGAIELSESNLLHEQIRRSHFIGSKKILDGYTPNLGKVDILGDYFEVARAAVEKNGDLRSSSFQKADAISP